MNRRTVSPPLQLTLVFLLFGTLWIVITDAWTARLAKNSFAVLENAQVYKGVAFVVLAATFIFFVSQKIFKRQFMLQRELAEERVRYRDQLAQEVFNAQEMERKQLGEELHDNINQLLGVVKLYIEHAQVNPAAKQEMLQKSAEYLMQVITEIRALSRSLISPTLKDIGLMESINELIENIWEIKNIRVEVDDVGFSESRLPDLKKLMVYRILQEQLNNVLKHSNATLVSISLRQLDSLIQVTVKDDGVGFDMARIKPGLGLKNIRHRLELVNGNMIVESSPGNGCKLEAEFAV